LDSLHCSLQSVRANPALHELRQCDGRSSHTLHIISVGTPGIWDGCKSPFMRVHLVLVHLMSKEHLRTRELLLCFQKLAAA